MFKYVAQYYLRNLLPKDLYSKSVERIGKGLVDLPKLHVAKRGALYLDGDGTAAAPVAVDGAALFNHSDTDYSHVIIAGGLKPCKDNRRHFVFPRVKKAGLPLPSSPDLVEAEYLSEVFESHADPEKLQKLKDAGRYHVIKKGDNMGHKVIACTDLFNEARLVTGVTLAFGTKRLMWTMNKAAQADGGRSFNFSVMQNFPFDITRDNWMEDWLSYAVIYQEATKSGPTKEKFAKFYKKEDLETLSQYAEIYEQSDQYAAYRAEHGF